MVEITNVELKRSSDAIMYFGRDVLGSMGGFLQGLELLIGKVPADRLLQMGLGVRMAVEGYDPEKEYSKVEWVAHSNALFLAQNYLRNVVHAVGEERVRQTFVKHGSEEVNEEGRNYLAASFYKLGNLSPMAITLAGIKPEDKKRFKKGLIKAVDTAYSMLQAHQQSQEATKVLLK